MRSALGGHISKAHPGKSQSYNHKKTVRDRRELLRDLHKQAMNMYLQHGLHLQQQVPKNKHSNNVFKITSIQQLKSIGNNEGSSTSLPQINENQFFSIDHGSLKDTNINRNTVKRIKK